jgi:arylsulfatase A-like enzyme
MLLRVLLIASLLPTVLAGRPNVLFLIADDLNTALSGYGHPQCRTPHLDRLAKRGVTFSRAYCQYSVCGPSRASIMSGQYPITTGVTRNDQPLPLDTVTLPVLFRRAGYWTGRVSKIYHMGVPGHIYTGDPGTDHAPSWMHTYNVSVMEGLAPGKAEDLMLDDVTPQIPAQRERWKKVEGKGERFLIPGNHQGSDFLAVEADETAELADTLAADEAIRLLRERAKSEQPFFLAVGFVRPHVPLVAPAQSFEGYEAENMKLPEVPAGDLDDMPNAAKQGTNARRYKLTEENQRKVLRAYYACITHVDEQVGRLLDELERLELADDTIVVFLSDHGYHLGEHTMWQKLSVMEEGGRIPLIIAGSGVGAKGKRCARIVESLDLYPTLAERAGLTPPEVIQGRSLVPLLKDPAGPAVRDDALIQAGQNFALRTEKWALTRHAGRKGEGGGTMLYDMDKDPQQFTNLAGRPEVAEIEKTLNDRLDRRLAEARR